MDRFLIDIKKLRQDAINELKQLRLAGEGYDSFEVLTVAEGKDLLSIEDYIKWKNNLTDEDVK